MEMTTDHHTPGHAEHSFPLSITYNGMQKAFEATAAETAKVLLDQAVRTFGITQNTHLLGLFTQDGRELSDGKTLKEQGVKANDHLLLRPSVVRGG